MQYYTQKDSAGKVVHYEIVELTPHTASESDLSEILEIQNEFKISKMSFQQREKFTEGIPLIHSYDLDRLKVFFCDKQNPIPGRVFVAKMLRKSFSKKIIGYVLESPGVKFSSEFSKVRIDWDYSKSNLKKVVPLFKEGKYSYIDQIGIKKQLHGSTLAKDLLDNMEKKANSNLYLATVLCEPVYNIRSYHFFNKAGYTPYGYAISNKEKESNSAKSALFAKWKE